mgnify:CR=1 FL=1
MKDSLRHETIIYGGAFNPPTLAHGAILQACIEFAHEHESEVWVMPSGDRLDKTIATPRQRRLMYVQAMIADMVCDDVDVRIDTTELDQEIPTETDHTIRHFFFLYPEKHFRFVFGADSTQTMESWQNGSWILSETPMLVVERAGSVINPLARHAINLAIQTADVSSTQVRRRIEQGDSIDNYVSASVGEVIKQYA